MTAPLARGVLVGSFLSVLCACVVHGLLGGREGADGFRGSRRGCSSSSAVPGEVFDVNIVQNPSRSCFFSIGLAPLPRYLTHGAIVAVG